MNQITLSSIVTGQSVEPPRILLYGGGGLGKTTAASNTPSPIFIQTEDGLGDLDVARFPLATSMKDVDDALLALYTTDHTYKTLVIDSLDWLEPLIWAKVVKDNPQRGVIAKDVADLPYGIGYKMATAEWMAFLEKVNVLRKEKGMSIIFLAHDEVKKFADPEKGEYNYYGPKLHKAAMEKVVEWVDSLLFCNQQVTVATDSGKFGGEVKRVVGAGTRVVITQERPSAMAKNRYNLPAEVTIGQGDIQWNALWSVLAERIPHFKNMK